MPYLNTVNVAYNPYFKELSFSLPYEFYLALITYTKLKWNQYSQKNTINKQGHIKISDKIIKKRIS